MSEERIKKIAQALHSEGIDAWLFFDFHNREPIAYTVLGLPMKFCSRRWYYAVHADGRATKVVSAVEAGKIDALPGDKVVYRSWGEMENALKQALGDAKTVAMQYSPQGAIPYVSTVDAGTVELVRALGYDVVSSADLIQLFDAVLDEAAYQDHLKAAKNCYDVKDLAFDMIRNALKNKEKINEWTVAEFILQEFDRRNMTMDGETPIVGVDGHPADPHFEPTPENALPIVPGSKILIDLWARFKRDAAIYGDITWCGYAGANPPEDYAKLFSIVVQARDAGVQFIRQRLAEGKTVAGFEVDDVVRNVVKQHGYGDFFVHRTGHNIHHEVHGNGANIDNLETKDARRLINGVCFSIEPGIYLPDRMAVRTEIDVCIRGNQAIVSGPMQRELITLE